MRFALRPQLKIVEGRKFRTGLRELIVGRGVTRQFQGAELGKVVRMRGSDWTVVGVFESGDAYDSELWADAEVAQIDVQPRAATARCCVGAGRRQRPEDAAGQR